MPDSNVLTLADAAMMSNEPIVNDIGYSLLINDSFLADLPLITRATMKINGLRWRHSDLSSPSWVKLNEDPPVWKATPGSYQEQLWLVRNRISADVKLIKDINNVGNPLVNMARAYWQSFVFDTNEKLINNDHVTGDPDAFVGIRVRLDNPTTYGVISECKIDAGALDISIAGMTDATANTLIAYMAKMLDYLGRSSGDNVFIYMNDELSRRIDMAVRRLGAGGGFTNTTDAYGRQVLKFRNATIRIIGRKLDGTSQIITNTETAAGLDGASVHTSMYAVVMGEDHFSGWQFESIEESIKDIGLIGNTGAIQSYLIDYGFGIIAKHERSMARVFGLKMA